MGLSKLVTGRKGRTNRDNAKLTNQIRSLVDKWKDKTENRKKASTVKKTRICPKCNSTDILLIPGTSGAYGAGNNIPTGRTTFSYALVNRYLCCVCGYSEEWIDLEDIPKLKKKYAKG